MADKSIWKKTLGWFVEVDEQRAPSSGGGGTTDLDALLAESQRNLAALNSQLGGSGAASPPLSDIVGPDVASEDVAAVVQKQEESGSLDFEELYASVCEAPVSIFKVEEILSQPELQNLPRETKAKAATVTLRAMGTDIETVIKDAYLKDKALDQAELAKRRNADAKKGSNEANIQELMTEVDAYLKAKNEEMDTLRQENLEVERQLQEWVKAKLEEEKRISGIVSHFVSETETQMTLGENLPTQAALSPAPEVPRVKSGN